MTNKLYIAFFLSLTLASCERFNLSRTPTPTLSEAEDNYANPNFPASFTPFVFDRLDNMPDDNPITNAGARLGRVLFYDKHLSANNTTSCASCHLQELGFAEPKKVSEGFEGGHTRRNSMSLVNNRFIESGQYFWDNRAATLEEQVLMPIQDEIEMGLSLEELLIKLNELDYYPDLFANAFGSPNITTDNISKALAQFIRSMLSFSTKYDDGLALAGDMFTDFPNYTTQENLGKSIFNGSFRNTSFRGNCASCHMNNDGASMNQFNVDNIPSQALFVMVVSPRNNGLDSTIHVEDLGIGGITGVEQAFGSFRAPSLRNIELTAPYMHDGRLATLEDVVEHYSSGVFAHPDLTFPTLKNNDGSAFHLNLSQQEKNALVAFLKTLTDYEFITDEKFSDPFKK